MLKKIFASHYRQLESVKKLRDRFPDSIYQREFLNRDLANSADLIIAAGGDEHFKYVSHYLNETPILGINIDPETSLGELLGTSVETALENLEKNNFRIDDETRIDAYINGVPSLLGTSIYAMRRFNDPFGNFRYRIEFKGSQCEHRLTSGLLLYTGNGIGDWTKGAGKYLGEHKIHIDPTERVIAWISQEPNDDYELMHGMIQENEELSVTCYKDGSAIAADAIIEHAVPIKSGTRVIFKISPITLKHVRMG